MASASARELAAADVVSAKVAEELKQIRDTRNWMVHRLCREERGVLDDPGQYHRVISRLASAADRRLALNRSLGDEIEGYAKATGVFPQFIEQESALLLREWGIQEMSSKKPDADTAAVRDLIAVLVFGYMFDPVALATSMSVHEP